LAYPIVPFHKLARGDFAGRKYRRSEAVMKEKRPCTFMPGLLRFDLLSLDESKEAPQVARSRL
jgi:hypothetical protein